MVKRNKGISFDESGDCPTEVQEQFQKNVDAFEQAKWSRPFQVLVESGIPLPPPGELAEAELNAKLWEVINALALMGAYLEHTDHLSDRELYTLLWGDVLLEEMVIQSPIVTLTCHIDLIGSGSEEDNNIYLKYYADEDDRTLWAKEFSDEPVPGRERLPFDRDRQLPKWGIQLFTVRLQLCDGIKGNPFSTQDSQSGDGLPSQLRRVSGVVSG